LAPRNPRVLSKDDQCRTFWSLRWLYQTGVDLNKISFKGMLQDLMRSDFVPLSIKAEQLLREIQEKSPHGEVQPDTETK
jgi:hypothetical protein